uniref:Uncharacterized protein n=1 Tax=Hyaloperonospora arabidopsidis (strain Emoy2) TaxID=559515 RepID=M4C212_HYAAE
MIQGGDPTGTGRGGESIYGLGVVSSSSIVIFAVSSVTFRWVLGRNLTMRSQRSSNTLELACYRWQTLGRTQTGVSFSLRWRRRLGSMVMQFISVIKSMSMVPTGADDRTHTGLDRDVQEDFREQEPTHATKMVLSRVVYV